VNARNALLPCSAYIPKTLTLCVSTSSIADTLKEGYWVVRPEKYPCTGSFSYSNDNAGGILKVKATALQDTKPGSGLGYFASRILMPKSLVFQRPKQN